MNYLTKAELAEVDAFDAGAFRFYKRPNRTRFYRVLHPSGKDMEVHGVAVKTRKDGTVAIKEVVRASVDEHWMYIKDIAFAPMCGYVVDWSPEKAGDKHNWSYNGCWNDNLYTRESSLWKLSTHPVINPEVLRDHDRFQYCSWTPQCGDVLDYLKLYVEQPRIELLSKCGAGRFASCSGFVRQIAKDKILSRFFMDHLEEVQKFGYGVDVIRLAYKRGNGLSEAAARIDDRREFRGMRLPVSLDATRVIAYLKETGNDRWEYTSYIHDCQKLGLDLKDTKVIFPRQLKARKKVLRDEIDEAQRRKDAEEAKKLDTNIAAVADRFTRLEKAKGKYMIELPRKSKDFERAGKQLANCLGFGYSVRMARGESVIAFVLTRRQPAMVAAVEYNPRRRKILQCYGAKNSPVPKMVTEFVNRVFLKKRAA